jgi:hypothetical protein
MSYCRFSTDDFQCDLYVYEHCDGGWMIHVASRKVIYAEPLPEPIDFVSENLNQWFERHKFVQAIRERSDLVPIGLSRDGESIAADSPGECADIVESLIAEGYKCPERVVAALRSEQAELD